MQLAAMATTTRLAQAAGMNAMHKHYLPWHGLGPDTTEPEARRYRLA
jgi:hypothetical protein